jgi:Uncharacterised nucleotidyltransferase/Protein of unknown function (DUF5672)
MRNMSSRLTLETLLILACVRRDFDAERIRDLVRRGPNWHVILRGVERWSLAPLVYTSLRQADATGQVPYPVAERLRHLYRRQTIHWFDQRAVLRETLQRFSESSVPAIVLKGVALATLVYPSPALRPTRKVGLLVRQRDAARAKALLKSMRDAPASLAAAGAPAGPDRHPDLGYRSRRRMSLLDVRTHILTHRRPGGWRLAARMPIENFWERARPAQIESAAALVFSPEDLLLHIAVDLAFAGGFVGHARTLCDIGQMCRRYGDAIDWSQVIAEARAHQTVKPLYYALRWARELVGAAVPSQALAELREGFQQVPLEDRLIAAGARQAILPDQAAAPISSVARLAAHLLKHHRAEDSVTLAFRYLGRVCQSRLQRLRLSSEPRGALGTGVDLRAQPSAIAIVLPIYRPRLDDRILATVDRAIALLQHGDWYLVAPMSLETSFYEERYGKAIVRFPDAYFDSLQNYSRLLLTDEFYATFAQYEYILVIQDDVYVLRDDLAYWQARRFDYIGAPWPTGLEFVLSMSHKLGIHGHTVTAYVVACAALPPAGNCLRSSLKKLLGSGSIRRKTRSLRFSDSFRNNLPSRACAWPPRLPGRSDCRACTLFVRGSCQWRSTPMTGTTLNSSPAPSITRHHQAADTLEAHDALGSVPCRRPRLVL